MRNEQHQLHAYFLKRDLYWMRSVICLVGFPLFSRNNFSKYEHVYTGYKSEWLSCLVVKTEDTGIKQSLQIYWRLDCVPPILLQNSSNINATLQMHTVLICFNNSYLQSAVFMFSWVANPNKVTLLASANIVICETVYWLKEQSGLLGTMPIY